jgi:hypothetical protein
MEPFSTSKLTLCRAFIPPKEIVKFWILRIGSILLNHSHESEANPIGTLLLDGGE